MNVYHAQVISTPEITMDRESQDRTFTFLIKTMPDIPTMNSFQEQINPFSNAQNSVVDTGSTTDSLGQLINEKTNQVVSVADQALNVIPTPPTLEPLPESP